MGEGRMDVGLGSPAATQRAAARTPQGRALARAGAATVDGGDSWFRRPHRLFGFAALQRRPSKGEEGRGPAGFAVESGPGKGPRHTVPGGQRGPSC